MGNKNRFSAMSPYPVLRVDTDAVRQNAKVITSLCEGQGIDVAGVIKFSDGSPDIAQAYLDGGCRQIASSRTFSTSTIRCVEISTVAFSS